MLRDSSGWVLNCNLFCEIAVTDVFVVLNIKLLRTRDEAARCKMG
jgi:hypothetical protein